MKTSVMEVHDMLSVLSVPGVENRIGKVPGVESVTVNHAAGSATVRYDETRLNIADIKSAVRQRGNEEDAAPSPPVGTSCPGLASGATATDHAAEPHPSEIAATPAPATAKPGANTLATPANGAPEGDTKPDQNPESSIQNRAGHP